MPLVGQDEGVADCVVVNLEGESRARVLDVWAALETRWKLGRSHAVGPHVTLAAVRGHPPVDVLRSALVPIADHGHAFPVSGAGYGVFVGHGDESAVIHLGLTRTPRLSLLHQAVLDGLHAAGIQIDGQFQPEYWRPHVTLADCGVSAPAAGEVIRYLIEAGPRHWTVQVDNLSLVTADGSVAFGLRLGGGAAD